MILGRLDSRAASGDLNLPDRSLAPSRPPMSAATSRVLVSTRPCTRRPALGGSRWARPLLSRWA